MATRYSKMPVKDEAAYQKKLELTRGYFTLEANVLEFGCGTGTTALHHATHVKHILATDISDKMLEIARGKAKDQAIDNVSFERHDIAGFDAAAESYDAVLAMSILHLIGDREAVMAKVYKWLKPGGVFVSSTICLAEMAFFWSIAIGAMKLVGQAPPVVDALKHAALIDAISGAGFEIEHDMRMSKQKVAFVVARKPV